MKTLFSYVVTPFPTLQTMLQTLWGCLFVSNIKKGEGEATFYKGREERIYTKEKKVGNFRVSFRP